MITLLKTRILPSQICTVENKCTLTDEQVMATVAAVKEKVEENSMQPYGEIYAGTSHDKSVLVKNAIEGLSDLAIAEQIRRWQM